MLWVGLIAGYLVLLALVTAVIRRRHQLTSGLDYYVGGRRLSGWTTAASLTATSVGGSATVVTAAMVQRHGLAGVWFDLAGALGFAALGLTVARRVRRSEATSIAELAGLRYGPAVRALVAWVVLVVELGWLALLARSTAAVVLPLSPAIPEVALVGATLAVVTLYTAAGGQLAVAYTDVVQLGLMAIGLCVVAPLCVGAAVGPARLGQLRWDFPVSPSFGWREVGSFLLLSGLPHMVGSDIYAKLLSARSERSAAAGALLAAGFKTLFSLAVAFVALGGTLLLPGLAQPSQLLAQVLHQVLPTALAAPVLLALVATMMSSADQVLLSAVTMVCHDLAPGLHPRRAWVAAGLSGLALGAAVVSSGVIQLVKLAYSVFTCGLALPLLLSLYPGLQLRRGAVTAAVVLGAAAGALLQLAPLLGLSWPLDPVLSGVALNGCVLLLGLRLAG